MGPALGKYFRVGGGRGLTGAGGPGVSRGLVQRRSEISGAGLGWKFIFEMRGPDGDCRLPAVYAGALCGTYTHPDCLHSHGGVYFIESGDRGWIEPGRTDVIEDFEDALRWAHLKCEPAFFAEWELGEVEGGRPCGHLGHGKDALGFDRHGKEFSEGDHGWVRP